MQLISLRLKLDIQHNSMRIWVLMQLKLCLCSQAEHLQDHHSERVQSEYQQIFGLVISLSLIVLVKIIQSIFVHVCYIFRVVFFSDELSLITSLYLSKLDLAQQVRAAGISYGCKRLSHFLPGIFWREIIRGSINKLMNQQDFLVWRGQ